MVTAKTETKTTTEEKPSSSFTAKDKLVENFLKNSSTLSNEERVAFFEKYLGGKNEATLKTSAGTEVKISKPSSSSYSIMIPSKDKIDIQFFYYDKSGKFDDLIKDHKNKDGSLHYEDSKNLWAEKRGDSFIKDLQKANKP